MKRTLLALTLALAAAGCRAPQPDFTLRPGDRIILASPERATLLRTTLEMDYGRTGRVVEVTRPLGLGPAL